MFDFQLLPASYLGLSLAIVVLYTVIAEIMKRINRRAREARRKTIRYKKLGALCELSGEKNYKRIFYNGTRL